MRRPQAAFTTIRRGGLSPRRNFGELKTRNSGPLKQPSDFEGFVLPAGHPKPCGYRRNANTRFIYVSAGHAATQIMPSARASASVSTESVTVFIVRNGTSKAGKRDHVEEKASRQLV